MKKQEQLPGFVLAELYGKSLVCVDEEMQPAKNLSQLKEPKKFYLGNYEKKIVVLINDAENNYLSDENLKFLSGILNACKLNLAHIALINFNNHALKFADLKKELNPEFLISFGVDALQIELPFTMPHYQVQPYNKCQIIIAPVLNEFNKETAAATAEKKKLWKSLQTMFNLEK